MSQRFSLYISQSAACCLVICLCASSLVAADKPETANSPVSQPTGKQSTKAAPASLTPEREAAAIQFVRTHHPELVELLKGLKQTHPDQYQTAVRQLFQTSERLARIRESDPQRYELELTAWKIKSRIQLLAARSSMSRDPELESQLRAAVAEQADVQLQEMQMERDRIAARLTKLNASIEQFQSNRQRNIQKQIDALTAAIDRARQSVKSLPVSNGIAEGNDAPKTQGTRKPRDTASPPSAVDVQP